MGAAAKAWTWFRSAGTDTKAWTLAGLTLAAAAVTLTATTTWAEATQPPPPGSTSAAATHPSAAGAMGRAGGGSGAGTTSGSPGGGGASSAEGAMPGMSGAAATADAGSVCPDVTGATTMGDGMEMAPVPSGPPTPQEEAAATQLVDETTADIQKYASLSVAEAAGYGPISSRRGPMTHYVDWALVGPGNVLDPAAPPSLMYANTVDGPVLVGAMFFGPGPCQPGPDIGGPLTDWHAHVNLCLNAAHQVVGRTGADGSCAVGVHNTRTLFMLHVWTAPQLASQYQFQADLPPGALSQIVATGRP